MATNTTNSYTETSAPASGSTAGPYPISFDYLDQTEVVVTVGGVTAQTSHYTFPSATTISFTSGNHPANGAAIKFQRNTNVSSKKVDFQDGSVLTEADLDSNTNQLLYGFQEFLDDGPITEADLLDQDNMASNSATKAATQQSIKAYVDANAGTTIGGANGVTFNDGVLAKFGTDDNDNLEIYWIDGDQKGYIKSDDGLRITGTTGVELQFNGVTKLETVSSGVKWTGDLYCDNSQKIKLGNSNYLEFYTDGTDSYITESGSGHLYIKAENLILEDTSGNNYLSGIHDGALKIYHHGDERLITTSTGITVYAGASGSETATGAITSGNIGVTGNITVSGTVDGRDLQTDGTKLDGIEASADITDATNVNAAGAVMNSDLATKGQILVGDGSGDPSALSVGTNNYVLTADSSEATGVKWAAASSGGISNVVEDTSPQLGGDLDVQAREITTSTTNGDIVLNPNGEFGIVKIKGDSSTSADATLEFRCSQNSHGVKIKSPPHSAGASYTLTLPSSIVNGAFLKTDSNGGLSFATPTDTNTQLSNAEVRTAVEAASDSNVFTDADHTKLNAIEASADVTDATNVNAAGAIMNSDLDGKGELLVGDGSGDPSALAVGTNGYILKADSSTATGLVWAAAGAGGDVNQNAFSNFAVSGQTTVAADSATDTVTLVGGTNVTITTNATNDEITFTSTDTNTTYSVGDGGLTQNNFTNTLKSKLDAIEASATGDQTNAEIRAAVEAASDSNVFTDADHTKLNAIAASANNYVHPNHSGEVTSTADGATVIADNIVDEANLKVSNSPTNGYFLQAQSGNTGGLTWAAASGGGGLTSDSQYNTIGGTNAGDSFTGTDAENNTLIGYNAGTAITTADDSVAVGKDSLKACTTGGTNTAIGSLALEDLTTGTTNTAVGSGALKDLTTQGANTALGRNAGMNCSGANNTFIGDTAGDYAAGSDNRVYIGKSAGRFNSGDNNIIIGANASGSATDVANEITLGDANITKFRIPGLNFVIKDSTATDNYVLTLDANGEAGWEAAAGGGGGGLTSDAQNNTVGGSNAGDSFTGTDAVSNTLIGKNAGTAITTADKCTAMGHDAIAANTTGSAGLTAIGFEAGYSATAATLSCFIGYQAGKDITDGTMNTFIGYDAGANTNSGCYGNTFIGYNAGHNNGNGNQNVAIGANALENNAAWSNIAIGNNAGDSNTSGTRGTFIGRYSGEQNTTGSYNFCAGYYAGGDVTTGSSNTFIGDQAGHTGTNNLTTGSNNTLIGAQAAASSETVSNEITIGDSNVATLRCQVTSITALSDRRDKTDINTLDLGLDFINSLKPVKFKWDSREGIGKDGTYEAGFIAQDFQQVQQDNDADYLGLVMDNNPDKLEATPGKLIPILVKAIQELKMEVETLKNNG